MRRRVVLSAAATTGVLSAALLVAPAQGVSPTRTTSGHEVVRATGTLSGRLTQLAAAPSRSSAEQARTLSAARTGAGAVVSTDEGAVLVQVLLTDTSPATVAALRQLSEVLDVSSAPDRATVVVAPSRLAALAAVPAVDYADLIPAPVHGAASQQTSVRAEPEAARRCRPLASEADGQLRAERARRAYGVDGAGVSVGVLSDSFDRDPDALTFASEDERSGDLPGPDNPCGRTTPVRVLADDDSGGDDPTDEGRAMLQAVHDLAPGAGLAFATAGGGPDVFANHIVALQRAGADVIVDDFTYFTEPFFQPGALDQAVSTVTDRGAIYVSSAGNSNAVLDGRDVSSWETPSTRLGDCPDLDLDPVGYGAIGQCVQFDLDGTDPGYGVTVAPGGTLTPVLQWAEPFYGVTDDFDLFLVDAATDEILASSTAVQSSRRTPVEWLSWTNAGSSERAVELVVNRFSGPAAPRLKVVFMTMSGLVSVEYDRSQGGDVVGPTVFGHNGGRDTLSVAAVPYDDETRVEPYSARGPVTHYFGPVKTGRVAPTLRSPVRIGAPQVAATDGYGTTFFGVDDGGIRRFYGTSAAAPAAAAVAALVRSANPGLGPSRVRSVLQRTAAPIPGVPASAVGSGLLDAYAALGLVRPAGPPTVTKTKIVKKVAGSVRLRFTAPTSLPTAPLTGYDARCRSSDGGDPVSASRSGTSLAAFVLTGLDRGKTYRCSVRARTAYGSGTYSGDGAEVVARGVPSKPRRVKASAVGHSVVLSFRAARNTGGVKLTGFTGTCAAGGDKHTSSADRSATTLTVTGVTAGLRYRCKVRAVNKYGTSKPSHRVRVRVH